MSDPAIDAINQPNSKAWWKSKTIWGLAITAVSIAAPKYRPIAEALPAAADQIAALAGIVLGIYGRFKADKPIVKQ